MSQKEIFTYAPVWLVYFSHHDVLLIPFLQCHTSVKICQCLSINVQNRLYFMYTITTIDFFHNLVKDTLPSLQVTQKMNQPCESLQSWQYLKIHSESSINNSIKNIKKTLLFISKCVYLIFLFSLHLRLSRFTVIMYERMSFSFTFPKFYNFLQVCRCHFLDFNRRN